MHWNDESLPGVFWAGLGTGIASVVPLLEMGNCFCCLWAWVAGAAALLLGRRGRRSDDPTPAGARAIGLLAGLWAGLVAGTLELFGRLLLGPTPLPAGLGALFGEDYPGELTSLLAQNPDRPLLVGLTTLTRMLFFGLFGVLGAVLAERLWPEREPGDRRGGDGYAG